MAFAQVCLCDLQVFPSILVALDVWFLALLLFLFSGGKINDVPLKQVSQARLLSFLPFHTCSLIVFNSKVQGFPLSAPCHSEVFKKGF